MGSRVREGRERRAGSEKDVVIGVEVLESLPAVRVEVEIDGGRSARVLLVAWSVSSRLRVLSLLLGLGRWAAFGVPSPLVVSTVWFSPLG